MSETPATPRTPSGADALIRALADSGVTHCFSNPGTSELDLVLALERQDRVRNVPVAFEGVASGAADGFARMSVTGHPAATLLHLAPGWHNACANLHNATKAASPVVNLVGDHASHHRHHQTPLAADLPALVAPCSAWWSRVDRAGEMASLGHQAVAEAIRREGVATLLVAADAAWNPCPEPVETPKDGAFSSEASAEPASNPGVDVGIGRSLSPTSSHTLSPILEALSRASRPALLLGGHAFQGQGLQAAARLSAYGIRVLAEHFPTRVERGGGRYSPEKLQYFTEAAHAQLAGCDLLVAIGTPLPAGTFAYPGRPDTHLPAGCTGLSAQVSPGQAGQFLIALAEALGAPEVPAALAFQHAPPPRPTGPITPMALGQSLTRHLPEGAIVSDDSVTASGFLLATTQAARAHDWLVITGGALGQGLPVAIGAALACPSRKVVCVTGDGAFLYTNQALWTLAREGLDITVIVLANRSYEILKYELSRMPGSPLEPRALSALSLSPPAMDHVMLAQGFGVQGVTVRDAGALDAALSHALSTRGPLLIDAVMA
jgi:acetolactate synthase-1/2/3 large subunit